MNELHERVINVVSELISSEVVIFDDDYFLKIFPEYKKPLRFKHIAKYNLVTRVAYTLAYLDIAYPSRKSIQRFLNNGELSKNLEGYLQKLILDYG